MQPCILGYFLYSHVVWLLAYLFHPVFFVFWGFFGFFFFAGMQTYVFDHFFFIQPCISATFLFKQSSVSDKILVMQPFSFLHFLLSSFMQPCILMTLIYVVQYLRLKSGYAAFFFLLLLSFMEPCILLFFI